MTLPRAGLELTALELDAAGTARALRGLRDALRAREDIRLVELAQPGGGDRRRRVLRGLDRELRWFTRGLARAARELDVLHLPVAVGPLRAMRPRVVLTVHDVMALDHPQWFTRSNVLQQRLALPRLVRHADVVVTPSAWSRERLLARHDADVRVIPWGVGREFSPGEAEEAVLERHGAERPYVLAVGTLQPRKGLDSLATIAGGHRVVVAGARGWRDRELAERLGRRTVVTGRVSDAELVSLLRGAEALVFPSAHEGFGFPPLEAMACGTPVVAVRASAVPEVVGEAAELAEPGDAGGLAEALERVLGSPGRRAQLRETGLARAGELTWERCAAGYAELYRELAGR